jgi:signal transduction histidine kinase
MLLVDRLAQAAMLGREDAETRRIEQTFLVREKEAKENFDAQLISETRGLSREFQKGLDSLVGRSWRSAPEGRGTALEIRADVNEIEAFRRRTAILQFGNVVLGWQGMASAYAIEPPPLLLLRAPGPGTRGGAWVEYQRLNPVWVGYDGPRALQRIQDALKGMFNEEDHAGYFQFSLSVGYPNLPPGPRTVTAVRSSRLTQDLPLPPLESLDGRRPDDEFKIDDVLLPSGVKLRRVLKVGGRPPLYFPVWLTHPGQFASTRPVRSPADARPPDLTIRVYLHHARPYPELLAALAEEKKDVEKQLAGVHAESQRELTELRTNLLMIGGGTFLALVLGGWIIVARGLAPVKKLSDAVSLVSEKDFRLPVALADMSRELAPVHRRLNQTLDQLREAFAREKQAVADISHELRTPIASLLATIDVSLRKPRTPEQYRTTLEDCRAIAKQLGQLVERIMTLASLDAGTAHTAMNHTDATELALGCAAVIRPLAEAHGLTLELDIEEGLELTTDRDKLREVLMNLLHNGVEYNQPGGRLDFKVAQEGDSILFAVRDTGIGIPPELRDKIFERFYRADASRHSTGVHAGLGLAIVKEYVQRLSGTITVESEPSVGSSFEVRVPATLASGVRAPNAGPPLTGESEASVATVQDVHLNGARRGEVASSGT